VARRGEGRYSFQPPPPAYAQYPPPIYAHPYGYPPPYRRPVNPAIPIVGGVFTIVAGAGGIVWVLSEVGANTFMWELGLGWCAVIGIVLGIIGVLGGILAMMKRLFVVALLGAICATLTFGWFGTSFFIGLVAVILVAVGKDAFDANARQPDRIRY
jgi:hypothetical protein